MLTKTITYTDYNGLERTENFYFNLSKSELTELELTTEGSLTAALNKMVNANDISDLSRMFKRILLLAYGEKSPDGRRFMKSEEISLAFSQTPAYDQLFMELFTGTDSMIEFINAIIPKEAAEAAAKAAQTSASPIMMPLA